MPILNTPTQGYLQAKEAGQVYTFTIRYQEASQLFVLVSALSPTPTQEEGPPMLGAGMQYALLDIEYRTLSISSFFEGLFPARTDVDVSNVYANILCLNHGGQPYTEYYDVHLDSVTMNLNTKYLNVLTGEWVAPVSVGPAQPIMGSALYANINTGTSKGLSAGDVMKVELYYKAG